MIILIIIILLNVKYPIYKYNDNRMYPGLDPLYLYLDKRDIILLNKPKEKYILNDFKTSQIETYQTLTDCFNLIQTLSNNKELKNWSF